MRRLLLVGAVLLLVAVALLGVWYRREPPPAPTSGAWTAVVTTIAGLGQPGYVDGRAEKAQFSDPFGVAVAGDGAIYVADAGDTNRIRRIHSSGGVSTVAGDGIEGHADGPAPRARFHTPSGVAVHPDGSLIVADTGNHRIRRISPDGIVSTLAGSERPGWHDGPGAQAAFDGPIGVAVAADGTVLVADTYNDAVRRIEPSGVVTTVAGGGGPGYRDGGRLEARFDTPTGVAAGPDGLVYVADTGNAALRRIGRDGQVTTMMLAPLDASSDVSLVRPIGVTVTKDGAIHVTDRRGRILHVLPDGRARVLAGSFTGFADGIGSQARFQHPTGVAADPEGALIVVDTGSFLVRRVAPAGLYAPDPPRSPLAREPGLPSEALTGTPLPWPLDPQFGSHEVAGTMGEARGSLADSRERFHAGIDVHAPEGTPVLAVRSAKVESPLAAQAFDTLNESVTVGAFTYVHLRVGRERRGELLDADRFQLVLDETGRPARVRVRRGTRVNLGEVIGTVNRFSHVHLNTGLPGRELNPLAFGLVGFVDTIAPTIARRGIVLVGETGVPLVSTRGPIAVSGRVRIVVDAYDRVDGNPARRRLGVYRLGYQVLRPDGTPAPGFEAPRLTISFDRLPSDARAAALVYAQGSGITVYGARRTRFLYNVTNTVRDGIAEEGAWDTSQLPAGRYTLRVIVADAASNQTTGDVAVIVGDALADMRSAERGVRN